MRRSHRGFTLVELLVVIAIIGMLAAIILPAVSAAREAARRTQCTNNLKELATAVISYDGQKGKVPGSWSTVPLPAQQGTYPGAQALVEWPVLLFPQMGRNDLYTVVQTGGAASTTFQTGFSAPSFVCPSAPPRSITAPLSYVANCGMEDGTWSATTQTSVLPPTSGCSLDYQSNGMFFNQVPFDATNWQGIPTGGGPTIGSSPASTSSVVTPAYPIVTTTLSYVSKHDGVSNTLLLSESLIAQTWWYPGQIGYSAGTAAFYPEYDPAMIGNASPPHTAINGINSAEWAIGMLWYPNASPPIALNQNNSSRPTSDFNVASNAATTTQLNGNYYAVPSSTHPDGFVIAYCDGSVGYLSQSVAYRIYAALMTPYGASAMQPGVAATILTPPNPSWLLPISQSDLNP